MRDSPCARSASKSDANVPNTETALCSREKGRERERERERESERGGEGRETVGGAESAMLYVPARARARHLSAGVRGGFLNTRNI